MSQVYWIVVLCIIVTNSIPVSPAPSIAISPWPPKLPTVPTLKDLNIAIRGVTSNPNSTPDMDLLETRTSENTNEKECKECKDEIIELEAEEFDPKEFITEEFINEEFKAEELYPEEFNSQGERNKDIFNVDEITFENEYNNESESLAKIVDTKEYENKTDETILNGNTDIVVNDTKIAVNDTKIAVNDTKVAVNATKITNEVKSKIEYNATAITQNIKNISNLKDKLVKYTKISNIATKSRGNTDKKLLETKTTKEIDQPLPTFVPIFRPKKQSRPNKVDILTRKSYSPVKLDDENFTTLRNSIENNDLIVQYVKNTDSKPVLNIFGPQDVIENSNIRIIPLNSMQPDGITVNSLPYNAINTNSLASNVPTITPLIEVPPAPHNTVNPVNKVLSPVSSVTRNRDSADFPVHVFPTGPIPTPGPGPENPALLNRHPTTLFPSNTCPANAAPLNIVPNGNIPTTTKFETNSIPVNPLLPVSENFVPSNVAPSSSTCPVNTVPQNYMPNRMPTYLYHPANYVQPNPIAHSTAPRNTVPPSNLPVSPSCPCSNSATIPPSYLSAPANSIPNSQTVAPANFHKPPICNIPHNVPPPSSPCSSTLNSLTSNVNPLGIPAGINSGCTISPHMVPVSRPSVNAGCNMAPNTLPVLSKGVNKCNECQKCPDGSNKADLVLFKPRNITVETVYGDFLKRTTMTILEPVYVSKLDV